MDEGIKLRDEEEAEFWRQVYIARARNGYNSKQCESMSDKAVKSLRKNYT